VLFSYFFEAAEIVWENEKKNFDKERTHEKILLIFIYWFILKNNQ